MTNNLFRNTIALTIAIYTLGHNIETVNGNNCTLDRMRKHAESACEILLRRIRSADDELFDLPYDTIDSNDLFQMTQSNGKHHHRHHSHHDRVRVQLTKQEFPNDGYLMIDQHLSKYLIHNKLDTFSYKTENGNSDDNNDDGLVISFMDLDNQAHHNHHSQKRRAQRHPRFRRHQEQATVEFCCRNQDKCNINLC